MSSFACAPKRGPLIIPIREDPHRIHIHKVRAKQRSATRTRRRRLPGSRQPGVSVMTSNAIPL
jgi:hypothetical protein